jgi:hypothetical protein
MTQPAHATTAVHFDDGDIHTEAGTRIPAAEVRARRIAREAEGWRAFAAERTRMRSGTLTGKALGACAFSVHHGTQSLAVPSKLVGTSRHQAVLREVARDVGAPWEPLALDVTAGEIRVFYRGELVGEVQPKHAGWVRPLLPFGLVVRLTRVTGTSGDVYRLGCNVAFTGVGEALGRRADVASGIGGDGAPVASSVDARSRLRLAVADLVRHEPAAVLTEVPVLPEREALTGGPEDIILWRTPEGEAHASVPHAVRHSPSGMEWGYSGSGPADLALSVLLALTDEPTANMLYHRFKHEVVTTITEEGGVLRADDIRRWVERTRQ